MLTKTHLYSALSLMLSFIYISPVAMAETPKNDEDIERVSVMGKQIKRSSSPTGLDLAVQETPQSISVINADFIESFDQKNLEEVMQNATGISRYKYGTADATLFTARGYTVNSFVKDGLPNSIAGNQENRLDTIVYDSVEILRGAAGIMAGAGEPSATLNLITKSPVREGLYTIAVQAGSQNMYRASIDASDSLTDDKSLAGRVILAYEDKDSILDFENSNKVVAYTQLHSYLGEDTEGSFTIHYQDNALNESPWGLPIFFSDGSPLDVKKSTNLASQHSYNNNTYQGYHAKLIHQLHLDWQLNLAAQYSKTDTDVWFTYFNGHPDKQTGLGLSADESRFVSTVDGITFIASLVGQFEIFDREHQLNVTYLNADFDSTQSNYEDLDQNSNWVTYPLNSIYSKRAATFAKPTLADTGFRDNSNKEQSLAFTSKISILDNLHSVVGVKFFDFDHTNKYDFSWTELEENAAATSGESMYLGFVYQFTNTLSGYTSYTDTYQPQLGMVDVNLKQLDPITGQNLEAGLKASLFDKKLNINLAVFDTLKKGVGEVIPEYADKEPVRYRAIDGAESNGFEFELNGYLTDSWSMTLGYSQFKLQDQNGKDINLYAPRKMLNFNTLYKFSEFELGLGVNWRADTNVNILAVRGFDHGLPAGGRGGSVLGTKEEPTLVSLHAKYTVSEQLNLQLHIRNVLDEEYYDTYGFIPKKYSEPRSFTLGLNYQF